MPSRPYQGVRVKEPVKELLKRKRGSAQNVKVAPEGMAVFFPHQSLPSYSPTGQVYSETDLVTSSLPLMEEGALYSGWLSQPPPATLQPLTQWTTSPDYVSHEAVSCPYTADMFVQPVCPSYTLVGTSSVLTYTSQPLITNFGSLGVLGADPLPQALEDTRKEMPPLTLEKLLQDDTNDTYDLNNSLPVEGL
ncbi:hypothetical protein Chor_005694 [Crotalus horridus]